jgi:hypothetical protein
MIRLFPRLRLFPDKTDIKFMKGRFAGVGLSALLSVLSVVLYFHPGLNYVFRRRRIFGSGNMKMMPVIVFDKEMGVMARN